MNREAGSPRRTEDGASAVEYGLLLAAIAALIIVVIFVLGGVVANLFGNTCDKIGSQISAPSCARS